MNGEKLTIKVSLKEPISQLVRDFLITDIGNQWDDYCYENNVPSEIKLHGVEFLEYFATKLNDFKQ